MKRPGLLPRSQRTHINQLVLDAVLFVAVWAAILVVSNITEELKRSTGRSLVMTGIAALATILIMDRRGLYRRPALPRTDEISRLFIAVVVGSSSIAVSAAFLDWHIGASEILIGGVSLFALRTLLRGVVRAFEISGKANRENVVIVGTGHEARELVDLVADHPESHFKLVGVVGNLSVAERSGLAEHWIGPTGRLTEVMWQRSATGAIVTATGFRGDQFRTITRELFRSGYDVHLTTGVSRLGEGRFDIRSLSHEPLVVMTRNSVRRSHRWLKRVIDILGGSLALILASPVMLLTAALIWIEDRGPITYTAPRAGRDGQFFLMYKFRSMVVDADRRKAEMSGDNERTGPLFKVSNDPRITRIGRVIRETSIDELPQLINVVKGDMSLVGPRPALPEEEAAFDEELRDRFGVRPGITGLWQVEARSNAAFNAYRRLDLHYVENWTLALDLRILLATVEQVVVTLAMLPLRAMRQGSAATDGVVTSDRRPAIGTIEVAAAESLTPTAPGELAPTGEFPLVTSSLAGDGYQVAATSFEAREPDPEPGFVGANHGVADPHYAARQPSNGNGNGIHHSSGPPHPEPGFVGANHGVADPHYAARQPSTGIHHHGPTEAEPGHWPADATGAAPDGASGAEPSCSAGGGRDAVDWSASLAGAELGGGRGYVFGSGNHGVGDHVVGGAGPDGDRGDAYAGPDFGGGSGFVFGSGQAGDDGRHSAVTHGSSGDEAIPGRPAGDDEVDDRPPAAGEGSTPRRALPLLDDFVVDLRDRGRER